MKNFNLILSLLFLMVWTSVHLDARNPPLSEEEQQAYNESEEQAANLRNTCAASRSSIDLNINNVRARLLGGGDIWWDLRDGKYIVPNPPPGSGLPEISSLFAGAVWLGGYDEGNNLKLACQTYRQSGNDFWPGPINEATGGTTPQVCLNWDKHFTVHGQHINEHIARVKQTVILEGNRIDESNIHVELRGWPAQGNPYFAGIHNFPLPDQELAEFWDQNGDGLYDPADGDFPIIGIRGCEPDNIDAANYGDQMQFWIYNDIGAPGNVHGQTNGQPIRMEVQVLAFAYATNDEFNNMTFKRFKLINRANQSIDSTYFAMWADPDLGCPDDDLIGCDIGRSLAIVYNAGDFDGAPGVDCHGANTYGPNVPLLGYDYFRGPLNEHGEEIGMSSFTYYYRGNIAPLQAMGDPGSAEGYYNYLSGRWRDGTPFTWGGTGYGGTEIIPYAFPDPPNLSNPEQNWSMCSHGLAPSDLRTIQASGPFRLDPGRTNELIIGVVWVPNVASYPCPDLSTLTSADDKAQNLFDACFSLVDGPDAPDIDIIELDRELIIVLTNDTVISNNRFEQYEEWDPLIPGYPDNDDTTYVFEGYKVYQLAHPNVSPADFNDPSKARLVFQVDVKNDVARLFNWERYEEDDAAPGDVFIPRLMVDGANEGIRKTFRVTTDQFGGGRLVNHKRYFFSALAYAYNNYEDFDIALRSGQERQYLEGRRNVNTYTGIPRIPDPEFYGIAVNASYGDIPQITRLEGVGNGGAFLDLTEATHNRILAEGSVDSIVYRRGAGPINVFVFDPLRVRGGEYRLRIYDSNMQDNIVSPNAQWELSELGEPFRKWTSERSIATLNEQLIAELGIAVGIESVPDPGTDAAMIGNNGFIPSALIYGEGLSNWYVGVPEGLNMGMPSPFNNVFRIQRTGISEDDFNRDQTRVWTNVVNGYWHPYTLTNWREIQQALAQPYTPYISPAWINQQFGGLVQSNNPLRTLNNVDVVITPDKSKWSRCVVVETANRFFTSVEGLPTIGGAVQFDLRQSPSVGKYDLNGDGRPDPDGDGVGMGWFPGYAIDVETGQRLEIFFGENSFYSTEIATMLGLQNLPTNGGDMMWNPSSQTFVDLFTPDVVESISEFVMGGHHTIYVTNLPYDGGTYIRGRLSGAQTQKIAALQRIKWASIPILPTGVQMRPLGDGETGLVPGEATFKLRAANSYGVMAGVGTNSGHPDYIFSLDEFASDPYNDAVAESALDIINVVPNPYYAYSMYETDETKTTVKITNLPPECTVTIYSLDGRFIREYKRAESEIPSNLKVGILPKQILTSVEWDLKNFSGIQVASGVYLIHVHVPGVGERVIKWFGITRQFDPSRL